jgi:SHS2 domain-containing protein
VKPSFELFDHTADMGIRVRAGDLAGLLKPAVDGLYAAIGELIPAASPERRRFELRGDGAAYLLRDFLTELLFNFERHSRIVTKIEEAVFTEHQLAATVETYDVDPDASNFAREVKAITYHELDIRAIPGGFEATLIVDI